MKKQKKSGAEEVEEVSSPERDEFNDEDVYNKDSQPASSSASSSASSESSSSFYLSSYFSTEEDKLMHAKAIAFEKIIHFIESTSGVPPTDSVLLNFLTKEIGLDCRGIVPSGEGFDVDFFLSKNKIKKFKGFQEQKNHYIWGFHRLQKLIEDCADIKPVLFSDEPFYISNSLSKATGLCPAKLTN